MLCHIAAYWQKKYGLCIILYYYYSITIGIGTDPYKTLCYIASYRVGITGPIHSSVSLYYTEPLLYIIIRQVDWGSDTTLADRGEKVRLQLLLW